jgi:hypothetical protein
MSGLGGRVQLAGLKLPELRLPPHLREKRPHTLAHCELDDWTFDPRYTQGRCPICGWEAPDAAAVLEPGPVVKELRSVDWDIVFLAALFLVLVALALIVGNAAHWKV